MTDSSGLKETRVLTTSGRLPHRRLGRISFDDALSIQESYIDTWRANGSGLPVIFSLEHDPVITCGRTTNPSNLLLTRDEYEILGIQVREIDRGGDVTYHGPGQLVVYPLILLRRHDLRVTDYVRLLEEAMIRTCADWDIDAFRRPRHRGCWTESGKIGAIGIAVKAGGITKHGIAFNVDPNFEHFDLIVPCGIEDSPVVSLSNLMVATPDTAVVEKRLVQHIADLLEMNLETNAEEKPQ